MENRALGHRVEYAFRRDIGVYATNNRVTWHRRVLRSSKCSDAAPKIGATYQEWRRIEEDTLGHGSCGRRGGLRVIYFWDEATDSFFMLFAFPKSIQSDLSKDQLRILHQVVREEFS